MPDPTPAPPSALRFSDGALSRFRVHTRIWRSPKRLRVRDAARPSLIAIIWLLCAGLFKAAHSGAAGFLANCP